MTTINVERIGCLHVNLPKKFTVLNPSDTQEKFKVFGVNAA